MGVLKEEEGAVLIMVSFVIVVALFVSAIVLDLGRVWVVKARLQTAADAATLAAIRKAKLDETVVFESVMETRTRKVPRYDQDGNLTGYDTEEYEVEVGKRENVVAREITLPWWEAGQEAGALIAQNADTWGERNCDGTPLRPQVEDSSITISPDRHSATYALKVGMAVPSLLYGPLAASITGDQSARQILVHVVSESTVSLSP